MGGKRVALPYDAEVEYLESTGTQYINTGLNLRSAVSFACSFALSRSVTDNSMIMGAYKDDSTTPKFQFFVRDTMLWGSINPAAWRAHSGFTPEYGVSVGVTYNTTGTAIASASDFQVYLFARNNDRGVYLPFDGLRLFSCSFSVGGTPVRDYIPVRVGSGAGAVGYLYDRVSGTLYGNAGTGNFTVGPDK
jgi:hypothetical protein